MVLCSLMILFIQIKFIDTLASAFPSPFTSSGAIFRGVLNY